MPEQADQQQKTRLVGQTIQQIKKRLGAAKSKKTEAFARRLLADVPYDDLRGESAENLAGAVLSLWENLQQRAPGKAKLRVYNPTIAKDGWVSSHTIVEIINDDMPFLVDSVTAEMNAHGAEVHLVVHPVMQVKRVGDGLLAGFTESEAARGASSESVMHVQISEQTREGCAKIQKGLVKVLCDVRAAVEDWQLLRRRCLDMIVELEVDPPNVPAEEVVEALAFLKWMEDDHFTYLGYRAYRFEGSGAKAVSRIDAKSGLGVLRDKEVRVFDSLRNLGTLPADVQAFVRSPSLMRITKANRRSTVHRPVHMDTIAIKSFDAKGRVVGERLFIGLFTSVAYARSPREIPVLKRKVDNVLARSGLRRGSHDGKALMHILETYPRDELFQISEDDLTEISMGVLHLQERQRTALFLRRDPFERFVSCMVYVPRDRYDTSLRHKIQDVLAEFYEGTVAAFSTHLTDAALARLHVIIKTTNERIPDIDQRVVEDALVEVSRSWADLLERALIEERGEEPGLKCLRRYEKAFPAAYRDHFGAAEALFDIGCIDDAIERDDMSMHLYRPAGAPPGKLHFKISISGEPVPLSDILPMLENMGFKVIGEVPYDIHPAGHGETIWMHDFDMLAVGADDIDPEEVRAAFHDAFHRVWHGRMENDGFNKLVLQSGLTARQVTVLRAYCKYLRQAAIPFSQAYMEETLSRNAEITGLLVDLFECRFDPAMEQGADKKAKKLRADILARLDDVANLDEDRIIRRYLNIIDSTLRTNFYQPDAAGGEKSYASFKFDARNIEELPQPRPFREIFVYSPRVEGVHLRFGMVARGGLRWSDRREDFRTEILGLVKAQQVKNAVIVPVGSKGGFVMKRPPAPDEGREAFQAEGIECYKTFIRGLLDITDNLKANKVVPPKDVIRHDGDDPYLVVAADKGTATFSDIANGVSQDYGHWLDDAFASGGSAGYDHKAMGITARGAWESVKRHFRELGKDIQSEDFTCIGCGDMAGDVFGNGMLLSKHIKLIGAFNHMHIWKERKRLFGLPRSSWADYEPSLISKGGGVFERKAKSIKLTPPMKQLFGLAKDQVTPNELIKAMLLAEVELMWFGGIGTYVKSSDESHLEAGDRANDALRIDGRQLAAKVIGEGANLGVTQLGRIEYGQNGGHCNTDAIDNSAGVDCSDHEVNIKILLGALEQSGKLTRAGRNKLLESMTDEVAEQCLRDNYLQTQAITITHQLGAHLLDRFARFMRALEKEGQLDRAIEFLPDDEMVAERLKQGVGLERAELAVLQSYSKIVLYGELLESTLPDDPYYIEDLVNYFPTPLRKKYAKEIGRHRLRREIITTVASNDLINRVGINFIHETREKTGMSADEITKAYTVAREILGVRALWAEVESLDNKIPALLQATMLVECGRLIERLTVWFLREGPHPLKIEALIGDYGQGVATLIDKLPALLSQADLEMLRQRGERYMDQGAPKALAERIASLGLLAPSCDIVGIARRARMPVERVAGTYFTVGERFGFDWLRRAAGQLSTDTAWDKLAVTAIVDDFYGHQGELTSKVLDSTTDGAAAEVVIDIWSEGRRPLVARTNQLLSELQAAAAPDFAMLAVANRQLKSMVAG
jgi:glutamate dehydrogenase